MLHRLRLPRLLLALALPLTFLFSGCPLTPATPGTAAPTALQTFDALYANAITAEDLVIKAATASLQAGLITAAQATRVLSITDSVKAALDAANAAAQLGNTGSASANLAAALGPIGILSACLTTKPLTTTTFNACTASLTPAKVTP